MTEILKYLHQGLDAPLFTFGGGQFTTGSLAGALIAFLLLIMGSRWLRLWMLKRLSRGPLDLSMRETVSSLTHYLVLAIGTLLILDGSGVKLSSFTVLAGALGVGVGFGLQNIFSNFISGLIVMFERPIKLGDHIVVAGVEGDVVEIGMRATRLLTAQGSTVIVPNQNLITNNVVNWDRRGWSAAVLQFRLNGKPAEDEALLLEIARGNQAVLKTPEPSVFTVAVDHAGHVLELHFWLAGDALARLTVISQINCAVLERLAALNQGIAPNP
jgi:small-conductance mechanosensitive channel